MAAPVDLSQFQKSDEEKFAEMADRADAAGVIDNPIHGVTAFAVVVHEDGNIGIMTDMDDTKRLVLTRDPTINDIYGASSNVMRDLSAQQTAAATQQGMMQISAALAQQQQNEQIRRGLNLKGN